MTSSQLSSSVRSKNDPAWDHFTEATNDKGKSIYTCLYCGNKYQGGGIYRMKHHLAGIRGNIAPCKKVPTEVQEKMLAYLKSAKQKDHDSDDLELEDTPIEGDEDDIQVIGLETSVSQPKGKRKVGINRYIPQSPAPLSQPGIKSALAGKRATHRAHMAFARWFFDACIPFNALKSPYFQPALDAIAGIGSGYRGPSYHDMRIKLLGDCKKECQLLVESYRSNWAKSGCTIMGDGWTDQRQRTLINFLVYCPAGVTFVKSIDASDIIKDANNLCNLFSEIVEWVGPANVVHLVTDNASNYVAAGKLLQERYDHIYWSPCAAHCLNLMLKDIGKMDYVNELVNRASKVTIFVYNHIHLLSWLRKRDGWKEIVRPGVTRFATVFITLKSIYEHKHDLQALATSTHFASHRLSKCTAGKVFTSTVLDSKFWEDCLLMVKVTSPIVKLLRIVDADERPSLCAVYEGFSRIRKGIISVFKDRRRLYDPYIKIVDQRWDKHFRRGLHAAAYYLNPAFIYDDTFDESLEVMQGLYDVLEKKSICSDNAAVLRDIKLYRESIEGFGREMAVKSTKTTQPDDWWRFFGHSAPIFQKIAIRILSQTASASGCERNWSFFERVHTKKRNRLEHQRLNDLVYMTYNLRLKNRHQHKKKNYDPIDYDCIDKTSLWIAEEDEEDLPPELNYDEIIEQAIYLDDATPVVVDVSNQDDREIEEDLDLDAIAAQVNFMAPFESSDDCAFLD